MSRFREVLIVITGSTPQVITETIQALATQEPPVHLEELLIITTGPGKRRALHALHDEGILAALCSDYAIPPLQLDDTSFVVISDEDGTPLEDIRNAHDSEHAGDQIADLIRRKACEPGVRLHCCLAGGRKTLTYYLGTAFQLFARQWDKLYHVMVSPDFEKQEQFFYKPSTPRTLTSKMRDGTKRSLNTADAEVTLIELPLIYLREKLPLQGQRMREMVTEGQHALDTATVQRNVIANLPERSLLIGNATIELIPSQIMVYTALLRTKLSLCRFPDRKNCRDCIACFVPMLELASKPAMEQMAEDYALLYGNSQDKQDEFEDKWQDGVDVDYLRQQVSKINKAIKEQLDDETLLPYYQVATKRVYGRSQYGIRVDKARIRIDTGSRENQ